MPLYCNSRSSHLPPSAASFSDVVHTAHTHAAGSKSSTAQRVQQVQVCLILSAAASTSRSQSLGLICLLVEKSLKGLMMIKVIGFLKSMWYLLGWQQLLATAAFSEVCVKNVMNAKWTSTFCH